MALAGHGDPAVAFSGGRIVKPSGELDRRLQAVNDNLTFAASMSPPRRPVELQADWQRILEDLTSLGLVEVEVTNPLVSLTCLCEPWSARIDGTLGSVNGPGLGLVAAIDALASATIEGGKPNTPAEQCLRWFDWSGSEVMRLALTEESAWPRFRSLLVRQWSQPAAPRAVLADPEGAIATVLQQAQLDQRGWSEPELADAWYLKRDERGNNGLCDKGRPVDPTLMAPFLEVIAEQNCPLRVLVGNGSVLQQHETEYYDCRVTDGWVKLKGSTASFRLAHGEASHACIVDYQDDGAMRRQIRVFDECHRTVVTLAAVADERDGDPSLWDTLVNALSD